MGGLSNVETIDVHRTYGHLLLRRCRILLRDDALADDAMQDVLVRLMRYGARLDSAESRLAWLYRVVDRCCFDLMKRRRVVAPSHPTEAIPGRHPDGRFEARDAVMRILRRLDRRDRQIAVAVFVDGKTQDAIADELGLTRQTVNRRLRGIRERARRILSRR